MSLKIERKIFHFLAGGILPLILIYILNFPWRFYLALSAFFIMSVIELIRRHRRLKRKIYQDWKKLGLIREKERNSLTGAFWITLGLVIISLFPGKIIPGLSIIAAGLADPVAEIVGKTLPYKPYLKGRKTLSGSLAFFITCLGVSFIYLWHLNPAPYIYLSVFLGSILATFIEAYSTKVKLDDNITVTVSTALLYTLLKGFGLL